ncbi:sensor histidine kinase [Paucibacter sp. M5-1]|uniref:sensor histidine kinase n=1 Tax=Paucibacter sp. M5-1 TaxID=3015998 RepID=UPI0022B8751E|nr:histidine kinase [Paucibacter sp. M5-1]MCZ7881594.1 histidine kinase [Paucibacter sp. M5-1]
MSESIRKPAALDWTQWLCPGPRRVFSAEELVRAGTQAWPRGIDHYVYGNTLVMLLIFSAELPEGWGLPVLLLSLGAAAAALAVARWLWRQPSRLRLNIASWLLTLLFLLGLLLYQGRGYPTPVLPLLVVTGALVTALSAWWFLTLYRVQQIEARLAELDEQARSLSLARRLATAQIQPHFLFNTLASLQHWVDTQDGRAGPTLRSFTRYLRATLPMFERDALSLAEELAIVRSYLEVMQARLGERLRWALRTEPGLDALQLPPGALLTLVENAIAHGIEPSLRGGRIEVQVHAEAGRVLLEVSDDGAGLTAAPCDGVGLANTRARLAQLHGERARLEVLPQQPGCLARITIDPHP